MEDRFEAAREVMRRLDVDAAWEAVIAADMPPALSRTYTGRDGMVEALRAGRCS